MRTVAAFSATLIGVALSIGDFKYQWLANLFLVVGVALWLWSVLSSRPVARHLGPRLPAFLRRVLLWPDVAVSPETFVLASGGWINKTSVWFQNQTDRPLYAVAVSVGTVSLGLTSTNIEVEPDDPPNGSPVLQVGEFSFRADVAMLDCSDRETQRLVLVVFYELAPGTARRLLVSGAATTPQDGKCFVKVLGVAHEPRALLQAKDNSGAAIVYEPLERWGITIHGFRYSARPTQPRP